MLPIRNELQVLASNPGVDPTLAPNRWVAGEYSYSRDELALCERAALQDFDPSLPTEFRVIGSDLVREVPDDLSVADQQKVAVERKGADNPIEEGPHVFVAPAIALPIVLRRRRTSCAMTPGDTGVNAMAPRGFRAPLHNRCCVGRNPDPGRAEICH